MNVKYYIIHNSKRTDRRQYVNAAIDAFPALEVCEAVIDPNPIVGCAMSHKKCLMLASMAGADDVLVLEDDVRFVTDFPRATLMHVMHRPEAAAFDIILGGVATAGESKRIPGSQLVSVKNYSATHCVWYRKRAWDTVMALSPKRHLDGQLSSSSLAAAVIVPFIATQHNSFSDIRRVDVNDDQMFWKTEQGLL